MTPRRRRSKWLRTLGTSVGRVLVRAARTTLQVFVASVSGAGVGFFSMPVLRAAAIAGLAGGLAALQNALEEWKDVAPELRGAEVPKP